MLLVEVVLVAEHSLLHVVADARDVSQVNLVVTHADHVVNHAGVAAQSQQDGRSAQHFGAKNQQRNDTELLTASPPVSHDGGDEIISSVNEQQEGSRVRPLEVAAALALNNVLVE